MGVGSAPLPVARITSFQPLGWSSSNENVSEQLSGQRQDFLLAIGHSRVHSRLSGERRFKW